VNKDSTIFNIETTLYVDPRVHRLPEQKSIRGQVAPLQHLFEAPNILDKNLLKPIKYEPRKIITKSLDQEQTESRTTDVIVVGHPPLKGVVVGHTRSTQTKVRVLKEVSHQKWTGSY